MKENTKLIMIIGLAVVILTAVIGAVGVISLKQQTNQASKQVSEFRGQVIDVQNQLENEKLAKENAQKTVEQLRSDLQLLADQNATLKQQFNELNNNPETAYEEALRDITKLTLQNCSAVIEYAKDIERDLEYEREEILDRLHKYQGSLEDRKEDLRQAIASGDEARVEVEIKRVDYMEDKVDDVEEELDDFDDYELSKIRNDKARAQSWCRRLERQYF